MDPNILEMIMDEQLGIIMDERLGIIAVSFCKCIIDYIFLLQKRRFINGFLLLRSLLTTMLHMQFWRVNQILVNGFSKVIHFLGGSNNLAFSGSKENVSHLSKFINLYVNDNLSSWLWENHFEVENSSIFMKLNWSSFSQLSNNSQCSSEISFCYCIFLFWWKRLTEGFPAAW